jgi:hypothetical protein
MPLLIPDNWGAAMEAAVVRPAFFYAGEFLSGTVYLWTGIGDFVWDGHTWIGAGNLLAMSEIRQSSNVQADGIRVQLNGISPTLMSLAIGQARQGRPGSVYLALLNAAGQLSIGTQPQLIFRGRLDVPEVNYSGDSASITITYESRLVDMRRARERRWTHEDQQIDHPGDRGFEYVASLQDQVLEW